MDDDTVVAQLAFELAYTSALLQAAYERLSWLEGVSDPTVCAAVGTEVSPE
jgi:hypothetical protein